jgi:surfeit locus 1 family protein
MQRDRIVPLTICLIVGAVCAKLGLWQLDRLHERRAANARTAAARALPALELEQRSGSPTELRDRRITASGEYDFQTEFVVRRQSREGTPGVRIATPLRGPNSDSAVLVIRGFFPSPDAARVPLDSLHEPGVQHVIGSVVPIGTDPKGGEPLVIDGGMTWARLDLSDVRSRLPYPVRDIAILQEPDPALPRYPERIEPAPLDDGPHLSYAVQWFSFATIAVVGGVILARKRGNG